MASLGDITRPRFQATLVLSFPLLLNPSLPHTYRKDKTNCLNFAPNCGWILIEKLTMGRRKEGGVLIPIDKRCRRG